MYWDDYLKVTDENGKRVPFPAASDADIQALESEIGCKLPNDLVEYLKLYQGKSPEEMEIVLPNGREPVLNCLYHAIIKPKEYEGSGIYWATRNLRDQGYGDVVVFGDSGNAYFALDYALASEAPPVVFINADFEPSDTACKTIIAQSVSDFFEKYS